MDGDGKIRRDRIRNYNFFIYLFLICLFIMTFSACNITGRNEDSSKLPKTSDTDDITVLPQVNEEYIPPVIPETTFETTKENSIVEIASYTTKILNRGKSRVNNIDIASEKLDKKQLKPGEEFSFNKVIGRRTKAKGYEEAPIIIKTEDGPKKSKGVGGGICQLSTTLFNVVEEAGLKVTERHLHSKDVGYVPKGEDATVAFGTIDFKFVNNRENTITIRVYLKKKTLTVKLFENR